LKDKDFRIAKSERKASEKIAKNRKPLKIKHFVKIFSLFRFVENIYPKPTPNVKLTLILTSPAFISIYLRFTEKSEKIKKEKTLNH
jgi:hypothetical protein